jgi:DNA-binding NtrC family response regulator
MVADRESVPPDGRVERSGPLSVLIVDDESVVRKIVVHVLRRAGYDVLDANGPEAALALLAERNGQVDLLITDMLLGAESGRTLATEVQRRSPGIAVLFMSGYPDGALEPEKAVRPDDHFLLKPFTPEAMVMAVESVLAKRPVAR